MSVLTLEPSENSNKLKKVFTQLAPSSNEWYQNILSHFLKRGQQEKKAAHELIVCDQDKVEFATCRKFGVPGIEK